MFTSDAISCFENRKKLAEALGIRPSAVSQWGERVPPLQAARLQELTRGALRFEPSEYVDWYRTPKPKLIDVG
jgi:transcriptional repressor of cell division inhibition gene dicB